MFNPREKAGTSVAGNNLASQADASDDDQAQAGSKGFSTFAALGVEDAGAEEEEDFGGLMVCCVFRVGMYVHIDAYLHISLRSKPRARKARRTRRRTREVVKTMTKRRRDQVLRVKEPKRLFR